MKKLLLLFAFISISSISNAQVASIIPNSAAPGQTLRTYITLAAGTMTNASPAFGYQDIYFQQGATIIYCDPSYSLFLNWYHSCSPYFCDSLFADFTIPQNAPTGSYDVHVITYDSFSFPVDNQLVSGFNVVVTAGTAEGDVYFDTNQNGVRDIGEPPLPNHLINISPGGITAFTDINGHYKLYVDTGNYVISYSPPVSFTQTSTPVSYSVSIPPSDSGLDFGAYSAQVIYQQLFSVWHHPMRCAPSLGYTYIDLTNNGLITTQGSITMVHSANMTFNNSFPAPDFIHGDTLIWLYSNLGVGQSLHIGGTSGGGWISFNDPPAGETIWYTTIDSVYDVLGNPLTQYADSFGFTVTCSCDPNEKEVMPAGEQPQHYTLMNSALVYTLNFQNTGNDTAFNIIVVDTLDANLDLSTLEILSSSDPVHAQMVPGGIVQFYFDNIQLPDSVVDEPASHGAVTFRIHPLSGLPDPTVINNHAAIIFDSNSPVITNAVMNTFVSFIPTGIPGNNSVQNVVVYPNPFRDKTKIVFSNADHHKMKIDLFDLAGRKILNAVTISEQYEIRNIAEGSYVLRISDENGNMVYSTKLIRIK